MSWRSALPSPGVKYYCVHYDRSNEEDQVTVLKVCEKKDVVEGSIFCHGDPRMPIRTNFQYDLSPDEMCVSYMWDSQKRIGSSFVRTLKDFMENFSLVP